MKLVLLFQLCSCNRRRQYDKDNRRKNSRLGAPPKFNNRDSRTNSERKNAHRMELLFIEVSKVLVYGYYEEYTIM